MTDEFENLLTDYLRGELPPEEHARMQEQLALNPELREMADDFRGLLVLAGRFAQDDPPEGLAEEASEAVLRELDSRERRQGRHLRLMMLQFQGSWGHGEVCLSSALRGASAVEFHTSGSGLLAQVDAEVEAEAKIGQVPLLKLQVQGSCGHGEGCLPEPSHRAHI